MNRFVVFSKGLGADGLCFKDNDRNENNIYIKTLRNLGIFDKMLAEFGHHVEPLLILGEVFGQGVQDLGYGMPPSFRIFAVKPGFRGNRPYANWDEVQEVAQRVGVPTVPVLYRGPFSYDVMMKYTSGTETASGWEVHMREGIVVTPTVERNDSRIGRVILKSVSEAYLLRKGNVTEYQ
jgi:RNA ligase (TIGR02306 family)